MRVVCLRLFDAHGVSVESSPWLTVGREYVVLELFVEPGRRTLLRLAPDDPTPDPALFETRMFRTVSERISTAWSVSVADGGIVTMGPPAWQRPGFWEDYYDGDPKTVLEYRHGLDRLLSEDAAERTDDTD